MNIRGDIDYSKWAREFNYRGPNYRVARQSSFICNGRICTQLHNITHKKE